MPKHADVPMKWTKEQELVLALVFEGRWSQQEIARKCDVSPRTVWGWMQHPEFQQRLDALRADFAESVREVTYADKTRRVVALSQMAESARREYEARPWLKEVRPGPFGETTNENFNRDAFESFRGALDDIAKEKGERKQVADGNGGVTTNNFQVIFMLPEADSGVLDAGPVGEVVDAFPNFPEPDEPTTDQ